jgi:hypothetical protein
MMAFKAAVAAHATISVCTHALSAAVRGLPLPAYVLVVPLSLLLTGLGWLFNAVLGVAAATIYFAAQAAWHPALVDSRAQLDAATALVVCGIIGYLGEGRLREYSWQCFVRGNVTEDDDDGGGDDSGSGSNCGGGSAASTRKTLRSFSPLTLWFFDKDVEENHRRWQMERVAGYVTVNGGIFALVSLFLDDYSLASEHPLVALALAANLLLPAAWMGVFAYAWWSRSTSLAMVRAFDVVMLGAGFGDGVCCALVAGIGGQRALPIMIPAIASTLPVLGQSWIQAALATAPPVLAFYATQAAWHPELVDNMARWDTCFGLAMHVLLGYLNDRFLRLQSLERHRRLPPSSTSSSSA